MCLTYAFHLNYAYRDIKENMSVFIGKLLLSGGFHSNVTLLFHEGRFSFIDHISRGSLPFYGQVFFYLSPSTILFCV